MPVINVFRLLLGIMLAWLLFAGLVCALVIYFEHRLRRIERVLVALSNTVDQDRKDRDNTFEALRLRLSAPDTAEPSQPRPTVWSQTRRELEAKYAKKPEEKNAG